jgi:uncharacterized protein YjiS (DUF1127 family)
MTYLITLRTPTISSKFLNGISSFVRSCLNKVSDTKMHRTTQLALSDLDAHQLHDIGLTRTDVNALDTSAKWAKASPSRAATKGGRSN